MNHYQILNLPQPGITSHLDQATLKRAYHDALLKHHPDKSLPTTSPSPPSIDAIKLAYTTLSDPVTRALHDRDLRLHKSAAQTEAAERFRTGEEVVDLDDLEFDETDEIWFRGCRCGEDRGFVVTEHQLEKAEENGHREVLVGCIGCSLWLRVGFGVVEQSQDSTR